MFIVCLVTERVSFSRLIAVGEEFCGSSSEDLHESIRTQTVKYFKTYHRTRMDELRMFLENEAWELCPVKASFKIVDLSVSRLGYFILILLYPRALQKVPDPLSVSASLWIFTGCILS